MTITSPFRKTNQSSIAFIVSTTALMLTLVYPAPALETFDSGKPQAGAGQRTLISDEPWDPKSVENNVDPKVIYGTDDRKDVYQETDAGVVSLAASTCALITASRFTDNGNGTVTIATSAYRPLGSSIPPCAGEPFGTQPVAAFCTGFLVGSDLVATAGHCYDTSDLPSTRFVFGFVMQDASTPVTTVNLDRVYSGVEVVGHQLAGDLDYSVIRLDRPVTAPGAKPLAIRRSGAASINTPVGVIGYPAGLPKKIAFGQSTRISEDPSDGYFIANLDTYGGNSGSPVFNQDTHLVEGILVRGQTDYLQQGSCFVSNVLPDFPGGEDVSKATSFVSFVPGVTAVYFSKRKFPISGFADISFYDPNATEGFLEGTITSSSGDSETFVLAELGDKLFNGLFPIEPMDGAVTAENGVLECADADTIVVTYNDPDTGSGQPGVFTDSATIDGVLPLIGPVTITEVTTRGFTVNFTTSEPTTAAVTVGFTCGEAIQVATGGRASSHQVEVDGLLPCNTYRVEIGVLDEGGNAAEDNNGGNCYPVTTVGLQSLFVENFEFAVLGWTHTALPIENDNWGLRVSDFASSADKVFSYEPGLGAAADAYFVSPTLPVAEYLEFQHTYGLETGYDGAVVEYSTNGGASYSDLGAFAMTGGYNGVISSSFGSPIGGRSAWTGGSVGEMTRVIIDLRSIVSEPFRIRFRFASDTSFESEGWLLDDVVLYNTFDCPAKVVAWELF